MESPVTRTMPRAAPAPPASAATCRSRPTCDATRGTPTASRDRTPALLAALHDPEPLVRAAAAWALAQRSALTPDARAGLVDALGDGIRLVRLSAASAIPRIASEPLAPAALRTLETAEEEWRASEEHAADTLEGHYNLALFAAARGDPRAAEFEYRTALRLWPT